MFRNRLEAADQLVRRLAPYRSEHPLVLAIPRGAVPMARRIAEALGGDLDVVLVRKLGAPGNPEFALGAVAENGEATVHAEAHALGVPMEWLEQEAREQLKVLRHRRDLYTPGRRPANAAGRTVIVVDDGVATGATLEAALRQVRRHGPQRLIAAVGVATPEAVTRLSAVADEVVALQVPWRLRAVGEWFEDFSPVSDEEVVRHLQTVPPGAAPGVEGR